MKKWRFIILALIPALLLGLALPVYAQIHEPDSTFQIEQIESYRNCVELLDQLYLISFTCEYSTTPSIPIDDAYIFRLMSGNITLGTTTAYGFFDSGYDSGIATLYFSATDAPAWSGNYTIEMKGNPTLHWLDTTAVTAMQGAVADDGGIQIDETAESNSAAVNDMNLLTLPIAVEDAYYFGSTGMFDILTLNIGQAGVWTGSYTWEYWDGDEWKQPSGLNDNSAGFTSAAGLHDITFDCPTDWQASDVNAINAYWARMRITAFTDNTTQPLGTQSWVNTLADPPGTQSSAFSLWYDEGTRIATEDRLTARLRTLATLLENDWGVLTDLIETTASGKKLTPEGEDYFVTTIPNLRNICPELFGAGIETPDFPEDIVVEDNLMGGEDSDEDTNAATKWFAQTFTASAEYYVNGVWLKLYRTSTPGTLTASIRDTVIHLPTGADLVVGTDNASAYTDDTDGEWYEITFTDHYLLTSGTEYGIVIRTASGNTTQWVNWLKDTDNGEANGQSCNSTDGGTTWTALDAGGSDFLFAMTGTDVLSMSLRDRLAQRLIGTRLDMTDLANHFNTTRMWMSSALFFAICIMITVAACTAAGSYKPATLIMAFLMPFGALPGFIYLEISILLAMLFGAVSVFILFHRGATA